MLQTQLISGTRTLQIGKADAISSLIIQESKAEGRRREDTGLQAGLYAPYRLHVAYKPSVNQVLTGHS